MKIFKKIINLKKVSIFVCVIIIISAISIFACEKSDEKSEKYSIYTLNLVFDEENSVLSGQEEVIYENTSENMFNKIYFHLYPNAFREDSKLSVVSKTNEENAYYNGVSYGNIDILKVSSLGEECEYNIEGEDENILAVSLSEELFPEENVWLTIEFRVNLPQINHRLGVGESAINFGNFYPIACVYEDGVGFSKSPYSSTGDPFYSDMAVYNVSVTYPKVYTIALSGEGQTNIDGENKKTSINSEFLRDFAFILSKNFKCKEKSMNGTRVIYYGFDGDSDLQEQLDLSVNALKTFNNLFGEYPYKTLSVVKTSFCSGGMEYPSLAWVSEKCDAETFSYALVHEIAHQWWFAIVGNDEYNHAWLDEGLAEYSTLLFYEKNSSYGKDPTAMLSSATTSYKKFEEIYTSITGSVDGRMDRALDEFNTEPEYIQCTYNKGVIMLASIRENIGDKKFFKALKNYFEEFEYRNASPEDFIATFSSSAKINLEGYIKSFLTGQTVIK